MTCNFCLREMRNRGWFHEFKIHLDLGDGKLACRCTTYDRAKSRGTLTDNRQKVTCQACLRYMGVTIPKGRWGIIGCDDALLEIVLVTE